MVCTFHCLNIELAKEWFATTSEYLGFTLKPFQQLSLRQMFRCKDNDWAAALTAWCVVQFWVAVVIYPLEVILSFVFRDGALAAPLVALVWQIVISYLSSHLFWFGAVKKQGCWWCLICCLQGPVLMLIVAVICWLSALSLLLTAASLIGACTMCFLFMVCEAVRSVCYLYMGICLFMLWRQSGSELVPPAVEVRGPAGETIGQSAV
mmetsp:Transcript_67208/g.176222  ORF Transcript_67208/g.176222 Transcript_67208/m.176222 type:complete len:207 (+) Transcript_67208:89-709(+)